MSETPLYVTPFEDETVKPFTARCRACGQIVKKRGYSGHAKSHVGARFVIDGTTYGVRELIDSPRNRYFLRREKPDVVTEGEPDSSPPPAPSPATSRINFMRGKP